MKLQLHDALYALTWVTLIALPLVLAWSLATGAAAPERLAGAFPSVTLAEAPGPWLAWSVALVGLLPWVPVIGALWSLQALFSLYRRGRSLTRDAAERIGVIGVLLMAVAVLGVAAHTAQLLLLTLGNPPGQRVLAIGIDSSDIGFLLAGGLLVVIGRAMTEAARAVDENRGFV